jgi:hypothetical protein
MTAARTWPSRGLPTSVRSIATDCGVHMKRAVPSGVDWSSCLSRGPSVGRDDAHFRSRTESRRPHWLDVHAPTGCRSRPREQLPSCKSPAGEARFTCVSALSDPTRVADTLSVATPGAWRLLDPPVALDLSPAGNVVADRPTFSRGFEQVCETNRTETSWSHFGRIIAKSHATKEMNTGLLAVGRRFESCRGCSGKVLRIEAIGFRPRPRPHGAANPQVLGPWRPPPEADNAGGATGHAASRAPASVPTTSTHPSRCRRRPTRAGRRRSSAPQWP